MRAELVIISIHNYKSITYKQVNCALTWRHKIQTTIEILSQTDILSHTTGTKLTLAGTDFIKVNEAGKTKVRPIPSYSWFAFPQPKSSHYIGFISPLPVPSINEVGRDGSCGGTSQHWRKFRWMRSAVLCLLLWRRSRVKKLKLP